MPHSIDCLHSTLKSREGAIRLRHVSSGLVLATAADRIKMMTEAEAKAVIDASLWTISHGE